MTKNSDGTVSLIDREPENICKLGQGPSCCAFLTMSANGFECIRMASPINRNIFDRLEKGTMNAKGTGGWEGCAWEGEI